MSTQVTEISVMQNSLSRGISFVLAAASSIIILIGPQWVATSPAQLDHGLLSLLMCFMCLLFVHGVGFQFKSTLMHWLVSPLTLWPPSLFLFFYLLLPT